MMITVIKKCNDTGPEKDRGIQRGTRNDERNSSDNDNDNYQGRKPVIQRGSRKGEAEKA